MQFIARLSLRLAQQIVFPPRWLRLLGLLAVSVVVAMLFYLGAKPFAGGLFAHPVDKLVHFVVYGAIAATIWVVMGGRGRRAEYTAIIVACAIGTADETVQRLIPTREASMADLLFDMLGVFVAVGVLSALRCAMIRKGQHQDVSSTDSDSAMDQDFQSSA